MKGTKTTTLLQVGDIIRVKTGGTVFSYAGETGDTDSDTAYAGDILGEVTKISGSSIVFKDLGKRIRNTVSTGSLDFAANPDFEYLPVKEVKENTTFEKYLSLGLGIFDKIFSKTPTPTGSTGENPGESGNTGNPTPKDEEKTFFQKYGIFVIIGVAVTALIFILKGGKRDEQLFHYQQVPQPPLPQNQNVRL